MAIRGRRNRRFALEDCTVEYRRHTALSFLARAPKVSPLIDLSAGGLQFVSDDLYDAGQRLNLKVIIPSAFRAVSLLGEVVWAKRIADRTSYRMGVRFVNPSAEDTQLLRSLEERHWTAGDERKRELEGAVARRYPIHLEPRREGEPARVYEDATEREAPAAEEAPPEAAPAPAAPVAEAAPAAPEAAPAPEPQPAIVLEPAATAPGAAPEAQPPAPEPLAAVPLYELIAGVDTRPNAGRLLLGTAKAQLVLPGITDRDAFALEVHDNTMRHSGNPSFDRGDVVVFSPNVPARSGDLAFAVTRDGGVFRQVFFDPNNLVRLHPLNSWYPEQSFHRGEVQGLWRLIAKFESYLAR